MARIALSIYPESKGSVQTPKMPPCRSHETMNGHLAMLSYFVMFAHSRYGRMLFTLLYIHNNPTKIKAGKYQLIKNTSYACGLEETQMPTCHARIPQILRCKASYEERDLDLRSTFPFICGDGRDSKALGRESPTHADSCQQYTRPEQKTKNRARACFFVCSCTRERAYSSR